MSTLNKIIRLRSHRGLKNQMISSIRTYLQFTEEHEQLRDTTRKVIDRTELKAFIQFTFVLNAFDTIGRSWNKKSIRL